MAVKATSRGTSTPSTMGRVVLSVELLSRSQGPVVSLGPHDVNVLEGFELVVDDESLGVNEGARSCSRPSNRKSGIGPGLAYGFRGCN